jgi:hypothetical protein
MRHQHPRTDSLAVLLLLLLLLQLKPSVLVNNT